MKRACGILLPVFSLPGNNGIGCFSKDAYQFVDFLKEAGQSWWQVLPLGPTSYGDSPYQSFSTFAGNPYFIDLEDLAKEGLLKEEELAAASAPGGTIDYAALYRSRFKVLKKAWARASDYRQKAREKFCKENEEWLPDYALFMALKDAHEGKAWMEWEEPIKRREKDALKAARKKYAKEISFYEFLQFEFHRQWKKLRKYANGKGIRIIGDLPIYVAHDSSDVWAYPKLFQMTDGEEPKSVAGCPPDAFSDTGQLWGNPLYDWDFHEKEGYHWWIRRMAHAFWLFDMVRIDHFRGFEAYYAIPYGAKTAEKGTWEKGPGMKLFKALRKELGEKPVIAEDLGFLTKDVRKLLKQSGYPGMKVLQFAFGGPGSEYLNHRHPENCIVYTGTHDNPTTLSWAAELGEREKKFLLNYLDLPKDASPEKICRRLVKEALSSPGFLAIVPLQDYLELGADARINIPSTLGGNWCWRLEGSSLTPSLAKKIKKLAKIYARDN
ncbi:MAG: 4-alpha-glucanotransferase [Lachnospiraceae bacterium]|nr:4-alpha-glucanotransferase [Lachnospiraceae bacterium]